MCCESSRLDASSKVSTNSPPWRNAFGGEQGQVTTIGGTLNSPSLSLTSPDDPTIATTDLISYLVTGEPAYPSAYALLVYTIDRDRRAVVRTQYYQATTSNLVKIRRDGSLSQLDGHWRPGEVTVENLPNGTSTQLRLAWRAAPDASASLFAPAGLRGPSHVEWPPDS